MRVLKFELYRAFHSRAFLASLVMGLVISAADLITFYVDFGVSATKPMYLVQAWIGTNYHYVYNELFYELLPLIACLPFGGSLFTDMKTGYDKNICIKTSRQKYIIAKGTATFLTAFVSVATALGLNLFIAAGIYSNYFPELSDAMVGAGYPNRYLFSELYSINPVLYCLMFILVDSLFAGVIALTSLGISRFVKSHFTAVATPMVIYIVSSMLLFRSDDADFSNWSIQYMLNAHPVVVTAWYQMLIVFVFIMSVNAILILLFSKRRDIL